MSPTGDLHVTLIFLWGGVSLELAQGPSRVALAWHLARRSTPFGVTCRVMVGGFERGLLHSNFLSEN